MPVRARVRRGTKKVGMFYGTAKALPPTASVAAATARLLTRKVKEADQGAITLIRRNYFTAPGPKRTTAAFGRDYFTAGGMGQLPVAPAAPAPAPPSLWANISSTVQSILPTVSAAIQSKLAPKPKTAKPKVVTKVVEKAAPKAPSYKPPKASGLPKWVLPVAIGGVALTGLVVFLRMRKKG